MKKTIILTTLALALLASANKVQAQQTATFSMTANVPEASVVAFVVNEVDAADQTSWTPVGEGSQTLTFNTSFDASTGLFLPSSFFAIDLATRNGAGDAAIGTPDLSVTYTEGNNPNGASGGNGLGQKGVITVVRVDTVPDQDNPGQFKQVETKLGATPKTYADAHGLFIADDNFDGGFGRAYLGLSDGGDTDPDTTGAQTVGEPFTFADEPGDYSGALVFSSTVH